MIDALVVTAAFVLLLLVNVVFLSAIAIVGVATWKAIGKLLAE